MIASFADRGSENILAGATTKEFEPPAQPSRGPWRGESSRKDQNQLRGYQLCVKHTNDKGGVLGRKLELVVEDDQSQPATAIRIHERLITQEKVDLVLGPYGSPITEAVADVNEKYRMPMLAPIATNTSIFKKGRKFIFMVASPSEVHRPAARPSAPDVSRLLARAPTGLGPLARHANQEGGEDC